MFVSDIINENLYEGPNDPHIFKAVFMAGGPGSGKSFVAHKLLSGTGLKKINSDDIYEYLMKKQNLPLNPETIFSPKGQEIRGKAKYLTQKQQQSHMQGRLGLLIDGTGKDPDKIEKSNDLLKKEGYETMMIFVNTSLEVAQQRNQQRERSLDPAQVEKMWNAVQQNIMQLQQLFGPNKFIVLDNSGGLEDPTRSKNFARAYNHIMKFLNTPANTKQAKDWLAQQK